MAGKQRSIFIRFNMDDEADCGLYLKLAESNVRAETHKNSGGIGRMGTMMDFEEFTEDILKEIHVRADRRFLL